MRGGSDDQRQDLRGEAIAPRPQAALATRAWSGCGRQTGSWPERPCGAGARARGTGIQEDAPKAATLPRSGVPLPVEVRARGQPHDRAPASSQGKGSREAEARHGQVAQGQPADASTQHAPGRPPDRIGPSPLSGHPPRDDGPWPRATSENPSGKRTMKTDTELQRDVLDELAWEP